MLDIEIGGGSPLTLISGPCVIENEAHALETAAALKELCDKADVKLLYKSSYDKANRSSIDSYRGPGLKEGLRILKKVRDELGLPVLTDIHHPDEAAPAAEVCAVLQIPAFLCRQTDLLVAAGKTGATVNVKKGQFMSPWEMENVVEKLRATGNENIILTDRGTSFGYNNLVSDMRAIPIMKQWGYPVCFDASHSVQLPGGRGTVSGGQREFIPTLAKAALAAGADLLFIESHNSPSEAMSDKHTVMPYEELAALLEEAAPLYNLMQKVPV
ncbi:3-deoxy-8-phosphooctulonate synthase [Candidatus Neptunochlamydia vexilliferae]|uniref:2-dehydro-3-deoxyphosphooctonate aldolase n=1 Tax=Candidatus Neptunichlamydia vexilliferae TaxID=1651774 RepID=A0ABS0AYZ6_9BACT|nr:3-deoxy-8-phosphooctulonate synthase [Candidatus Neptunochlamydia vexilliferae]MBF5059348.1 2-dehydro-3-deoxyphosphooctonate aldolase [Candidatus Neptunochlamydia vexilliferae]